MSGSRFAYPLTRNIDGDAGGAADLQTDVMRFMAILSLCLMAIFALVQSLPITPLPAPVETPSEEPPAKPITEPPVKPVAEQPVEPVAEPAAKLARPPETVESNKVVVVTRPKWQPKAPPVAAPQTAPAPIESPEAADDEDGFSLRFESDQALMRLVATSKVGLYAIESGRAQRMTVSDSRISFWSASTPNTFHEMETATVPPAVVDALARTGTTTSAVSWGVTLPGMLRSQLDTLMNGRSGGDLVIGKDGNLRLDET